MTCIVGLKHNGEVYMGADSLSSNGHTKTVIAREKVFHNDEYLIGSCGSVRQSQLLRYAFKPPTPPDDPRDLYGFLVTDFVNALKDTFIAGGYGSHKDKEAHDLEQGKFLIAVRGDLFQIDADYQVAKSVWGYESAGSGEHHALGSLATSEGRIKAPKMRIEMALDAASQFVVSVGGPYVIEKLLWLK